MEIPFKSVWQIWLRTPAPLFIALFVVLYVAGIAYYNHYLYAPKPEFDFYNKSRVYVTFNNPNEQRVVSGTYNNVIEGQRKSVQAKRDSIQRYVLQFDVNSPRPAKLFIEGDEIEIFLTKDSALYLTVFMDTELGAVDSVQFKGLAAPICYYYQEKKSQFDETATRTSLHTLEGKDEHRYLQQLDSMRILQDSFLIQKSRTYKLPDWFVKFESNEIQYQNGYLKLANSKKSMPVALPLDNPDAVFSYYYYLYLTAYFQQQSPNDSSTEMELLTKADTMLKTEARDVFFSRVIFSHLQKKDKVGAEKIFSTFNKFKQQKYYRFLKREIAKLGN